MRAKRVDANQPAVVAALEAAGASVQHLHTVGDDCPDLLVGFEGKNYLVEVKNPAAGGELSPGQKRWHRTWRGQVTVITSAEQGFDFVRSLARGAGR